MYEDFVRSRLAQLRTQRGVSARDMSLSLGQNNSYINHIELGHSLPSLQGLFYICDYLGISPRDFFDDGMRNPEKLSGIIEELKKMDDDSLEDIERVIKKMNE